MSRSAGRVIGGWWVLVLVGAALALLVAWLSRIVSVPITTVLTVGAVVLALSWLAVLATVPWNLYFSARRAAAEMVVSRERGIAVRPGDDAEARRIAGRMLRFAVGAHAGTALAAAAIAYLSGNETGYYIAGIFLLSTAFRPAAAYFLHVRERVKTLTSQSTHPREDVVTLGGKVEMLEEAVGDLRADLERAADDLGRTESRLSAEIGHAQRRIDQMMRMIEANLDGLTDHEELLAGLRALVRMVRSESA